MPPSTSAIMLRSLFSTAARTPIPSASRAIASKSWLGAAASTSPCVSEAAAASCSQHSLASVTPPAHFRSYTTTPPTLSLDEFRDSVPRIQRMREHVGRQWTVKELRRKSFDDLHKLWYVLYKEKNMLLTEKHLSRANNLKFPQPYRWTKVKRSMKAIKVVLGERKRERAAMKAEIGDDSDSEEEEEREEQKTT